MTRSTLTALAAFAGGVLLAGAIALWTRAPAPAPPPPAPVAVTPAPPPPPSEDDPFHIPKDRMPELMKKLEEIRGPKPEEEDVPIPALGPVEYKKAEKYADEELSEVPHDLVGAWDDQGDEPARGEHRAFVLVVDESMTDAQLSTLVRDIWDRHADAARLDVRVYDREDAATDSRTADDGKYARKHLVAQGLRHRALKVEVIRVRGRVVGP